MEKNYLLRVKNVCEIAQKHYELGNYNKSYYKIWKNIIYPLYPMCYRTFLNYIHLPYNKLLKNLENK